MESDFDKIPAYPARGSHSLRKCRMSLAGHFYFLRASTADQRPLFLESSNCRIVFDAIRWLDDHQRWVCFCAMVMPDHIHVVARLRQHWRLEQAMHSLKSFTGKKILEKPQIRGPVWQDGYYDHCIRDDRALREIILYCYYNPVRKGLVERPEDYPYWWCRYRL